MANGSNDVSRITAPDAPPKRPNVVRRLYNWVLHWADTPYGTPALGVLAFTESSFFPIPPDVLLIALAVSKPKRSFRYATVCSVMSVIGGFFGYLIGYALMEAVGNRVLEFYGYTEQFAELQKLFQDQGFLWVLAAALTPIPYKVFTIAAGTVSLNLLTFAAASVLGRSARFFAVAALVRIFGPSIKRTIEKYFNLATVVFMVLLILGFVVIKYVMH